MADGSKPAKFVAKTGENSKSLPSSTRTALGKYKIIRKLGAGGMAAVYLAEDTKKNRTVALKVLSKARSEDPVRAKRFKAEAMASANLRHENIVRLYEAGEIEGYLYLALEYVEGTDLDKLVKQKGTIGVDTSVAIIRQVVRALSHSYKQEIVHRDIKPSNILFRTDGKVKLADMGLARPIGESTGESSMTQEGVTVGTIDYIAPEQAHNSKAADTRSDMYSLGCTWYFMLTGEPPFPEGNPRDKLYAHWSKPAPDPRAKNPQVSLGVAAVIERLMEKEPEDRYETPAELLEELEKDSLTRDTVQDNLIAALLDVDVWDEDEELPAAAVSSDAVTTDAVSADIVISRKPAASAAPSSLPPRVAIPRETRRSTSTQEDFDRMLLKYIAMGVGFVLLIMLIVVAASMF